MRRLSLLALTLVVSLVVGAGGAQAVVVQNSQGNKYGVALVPGTGGQLGATNFSPVVASPSSPCYDPGLSADLGGPFLPSGALCLQDQSRSAVLQRNETFAVTWDASQIAPKRRHWETTRGYFERFLRDVADGSNALTSPFAITSQYTDALGERALNSSIFAGGCIDYGNPGGYTCQFAGGGTGHTYPSGDPLKNCTPTGSSDNCLTDSAIQQEVRQMVTSTQLVQGKQPGHTPVVVISMPPNVEVCLDSGGKLCSANSPSTAQFCSYHSQVDGIPYVVQPWSTYTACDEPKLPPLPADATPQQVQTDAGVRLVNPLSQGLIATIVNPFMNGWVANDGSEINDNGGCQPLGPRYDSVAVGSSGQNPYVLQREFNNAGAIDSEPNTYFGCAPNVLLSPTFVIPSAVNSGDVVQFDGSTTASTLIVPKDNYAWNFGDGTTAIGPSVEHSYAKGGTYAVKLTVTDRGGNVASLSQTITVLGPNGQPVSPPHTSGPRPRTLPALRLQFMPQGLRTMLRVGLSVRVSSNERADGIATLSISRKSAKQAHIRTGRGPTVVIGRGTVSGITNGTVNLHLRLSRAMAAKLRHLRHVTLTLRLALVTAGGVHLAIDAAGRY